MRAHLWVTAIVMVLATAVPGAAATKLTPDEIKATFFTGQPFTAATPSGVAFKMIFTADGKVVRQPAGKSGSKGEGTWQVSADGFCTTWKNAKQSCFTIVNAGQNKWSVMKGQVILAVWSK
jgi:hypothetical protein